MTCVRMLSDAFESVLSAPGSMETRLTNNDQSEVRIEVVWSR